MAKFVRVVWRWTLRFKLGRWVTRKARALRVWLIHIVEGETPARHSWPLVGVGVTGLLAIGLYSLSKHAHTPWWVGAALVVSAVCAIVGLFLLLAPWGRKLILRHRGETEEIIHIRHNPSSGQTRTTKSDGSSSLAVQAQPAHAQASAAGWRAPTGQAAKDEPAEPHEPSTSSDVPTVWEKEPDLLENSGAAPYMPPWKPSPPPSFQSELQRAREIDRGYDGSEGAKQAVQDWIQDVYDKLYAWLPRHAEFFDRGGWDDLSVTVTAGLLGIRYEDEEHKELARRVARLRSILGTNDLK